MTFNIFDKIIINIEYSDKIILFIIDNKMNDKLKRWKLIIGWPFFLFIIFRTFLIYRKLHNKKKQNHRIPERKRYLWCYRYSKILLWFFSPKFTIQNLDKWTFGPSCLIVNWNCKILPLIFIKINDFKKIAPLSFIFTHQFLKSLPFYLKHFYLILNYFIIDENNLKLETKIVNNLKIPRSLLVTYDQSFGNNKRIASLLTTIIGASLSNLYFINTKPQNNQIIVKFENNFSSKSILHVNKNFLTQKIVNFLTPEVNHD